MMFVSNVRKEPGQAGRSDQYRDRGGFEKGRQADITSQVVELRLSIGWVELSRGRALSTISMNFLVVSEWAALILSGLAAIP